MPLYNQIGVDLSDFLMEFLSNNERMRRRLRGIREMPLTIRHVDVHRR